jgi:hypothetical protein
MITEIRIIGKNIKGRHVMTGINVVTGRTIMEKI